jgi:hypothetical protein
MSTLLSARGSLRTVFRPTPRRPTFSCSTRGSQSVLVPAMSVTVSATLDPWPFVIFVERTTTGAVVPGLNGGTTVSAFVELVTTIDCSPLSVSWARMSMKAFPDAFTPVPVRSHAGDLLVDVQVFVTTFDVWDMPSEPVKDAMIWSVRGARGVGERRLSVGIGHRRPRQPRVGPGRYVERDCDVRDRVTVVVLHSARQGVWLADRVRRRRGREHDPLADDAALERTSSAAKKMLSSLEGFVVVNVRLVSPLWRNGTRL